MTKKHICNPELIKTGSDLLDFPAICFVQSGYRGYVRYRPTGRQAFLEDRLETAGKSVFLRVRKHRADRLLALMAKNRCQPVTSVEMPGTRLDVPLVSDLVETNTN